MDPVSFSVRNWQFTTIVLLFLVAMGAQAWLSIPRTEDPSYDTPTFAVVAILPGATPSEIETRVVNPLEARIRAMDHVERVRSEVDDGVAVIVTDFQLSADPDERYASLLREVETTRPDLPDDLYDMEVQRYNPQSVHVLQLAVVGADATLDQLRDAARAVREAAGGARGVHAAEIDGLPEERVEVTVDPARLAAAGLPVSALLGVVGANGARILGGHVEGDQHRYAVTADASWTSPEQIAATPITMTPAGPLLVGSVADVGAGYAEPDYLTRYDRQRAVWVSVSLNAGVNVFEARDAVLEAVDQVKATLPPAVNVVCAFDQSRNVERRLAGFLRDFALAIALVLVTLVPLGLRASAVVMVSIPLSLAVGLAGLRWAGHSLNQVTIVGFVVSLGLLVDDAIVVIENVSRHLRQGKDRARAAIDGTREIALAVAGCTATLLIAFLPLASMPGSAGLFIRGFPLTVVFTVAASLGISLTIVPLLASAWLRPQGEHGNAVLRALNHVIELTYRPVLRRAMARPGWTLLAATALFGGSLALLPVVGVSLFPGAGIPQLLVDVDAGTGAALSATDTAVRFVEDELARTPEVVATMANVGQGNPRIYYNVVRPKPSASLGQVFVRLDRYDPDNTPALLDRLRETFAGYGAARITVREFANGPVMDAPVAVRLLGTDLAALREGAAIVASAMAGVEGLTDIRDPLSTERTDLSVVFQREAAGRLGVSAIDVARGVRFALSGLQVGTLRAADGREIPIVARVAGAGQPGPDRISGLILPGATGPVPLSAVTSLVQGRSAARISHQDGERSVTVLAGVKTGTNVARATAAVRDALDATTLPQGVRWQPSGEAESRSESFAGVSGAALLAALGVLAVLVLEFRNFRSTLVVVSVVPLGVTGALVALWLTGNTLSFTASVGLVALLGIEVKNSILLVDFAAQLQRDGLERDAAIARAGEVRFVPILLTTATALGGLVPLALERSALYSPLAIVMIGGLLSSTLLTRLVTPVAYKLLVPPTGIPGERPSAAVAPPAAR